MTLRQGLRSLGVVVVTLLVQTCIAQKLTIGGAHPNVLLLLPIAAGMVGGAEEGAVFGFASGLAADLVLPTPLGLWALVSCVIGTAVGVTTGSIVRQVWWFRPLIALLASAVAVLLYAVLGAILGQEQFLHTNLAAIVAVISVVNALLAVPAFRLIRWAVEVERIAGPRPTGVGERSRW